MRVCVESVPLIVLSNYENIRMFIIEGMDKVRDIVEMNRKRKLTNHQPK